MANPEHLTILEQGVEKWNQWRKETPDTTPELTWADLSRARLNKINLSNTDLTSADMFAAVLSEADLSGAKLSGTNLSWANLSNVNFSGAMLNAAKLNGANLNEADFSHAEVGYTTFGENDLRVVKGLDKIRHIGPSTIGIDTLFKSGGRIPEFFLRSCGVPEQFITYIPSLVGQAIQYYSCFISYSSRDQAFADRLYADLQSRGVRCWFAPEDMKIGDRFRIQIDESIRVHEKLLLILSENSVASDWVEKEVETAMEKERESRKPALFPVRLDDSVNAIKSGWAADVRRTRHIGDFSKWKSHDEYEKVFERLLRDLRVEASEEEKPRA
jgi:hypothetical protein